MKTNVMFKKGRKNVRRQKYKDLCAVLIFFCLFPYVCSLLISGRTDHRFESMPALVEGPEDGIHAASRRNAGTEYIPLEAWLTGTLAASIPIDCELETLKAQAVILRTICMRTYLEREDTAQNYFEEEKTGQEYLTVRQLQNRWGESFSTNYEKVCEAVKETEGIILLNEGEVINPSYCWMSAGRTRDGNEVLGEEKYPYLVGVESPEDMKGSDFTASTLIPLESFLEAMGLPEETNDLPQIVLTRDNAGYVLTIEAGAGKISGDYFRTLFSLPSACFTLEEEEGSIRITTKGTGHGLGFSQYAANEKALSGEVYTELLKYYFTGVDVVSN